MKELEEEAQKTREGTTSKCHTSHMVREVKFKKKQKPKHCNFQNKEKLQ